MFGDPAVTGKPAGDDLREGKRTLLVALAMQAADDTQAGALRDGLGRRTLESAEIADLRQIIVDTGALEQVEQRITQRAGEARAALNSPALSPEAQLALDALAGAAPQLHDDVQGVFDDQAVTGKPAGDDLRESK